jgi:hypothetical protein
MDEFKLLIEMVANLPTLAVWVLVGYLVYKVVVIGSIYGLARFAIDKLHNWLTDPKRKTIDFNILIEGEVISGSREALMAQMRRIKRATGVYIHSSDIDWLRYAIDDRIAKDAEEAVRKAKEKAKD